MPRKHHRPEHVETPSPYVERPPLPILDLLTAGAETDRRIAAQERFAAMARAYQDRAANSPVGTPLISRPVVLDRLLGRSRSHASRL